MGLRKKILMGCCNYWSSPFQVGSHNIAKAFLKLGWDVAFISDPISPLHILAGLTTDLKERYYIYRKGGLTEYDDKFWTYVPGALCTPHNKFILRNDWVHNHWFRLTMPNLLTKIREYGFGDVDLLYIDSIKYSCLLDNIRYAKSLFRIADKNIGFDKATPNTYLCEQDIARKVDIVLYTALTLEKYINNLNPQKMLYFPNGVNFTHFVNGTKLMPADMQNIPKPIAIYVGALDVWFNYDLINMAARKLPNISFVLIGPDKMAKQKLQKADNIYLLGKKDYNDIPAYLWNANVGIIPFAVKKYPELVNHINPLKLYEYMSCGLPVVATEWAELLKINSLAILSKDVDTFVNGISQKVMDTNRLQYINYAKQCTWEDKVAKLVKQIY